VRGGRIRCFRGQKDNRGKKFALKIHVYVHCTRTALRIKEKYSVGVLYDIFIRPCCDAENRIGLKRYKSKRYCLTRLPYIIIIIIMRYTRLDVYVQYRIHDHAYVVLGVSAGLGRRFASKTIRAK